MSPEPLMPVETYGGIQQGTGKVRNHQYVIQVQIGTNTTIFFKLQASSSVERITT